MGALDYVSDICDCSLSHRGNQLKKHKPLRTVETKVRMDCEGCERRVRKAVEGMKAVSQVEVDRKQSLLSQVGVDRKQHKLTVTGYVDPDKEMQRVRHRAGKKDEMWPYVPYNVIPHLYAPNVYDKKAPPLYVRNVLAEPHASTCQFGQGGIHHGFQ